MQNLLYIFADQWRAHAIGAAAQDDVRTPSMDAFAAESMAFHHAFSTYPLCSPHRASLLTGKYPYSCGIWTNCKTGLDEVVMLKPQEITIGDILKAAGYQTAYIGKWHLDAAELNFTSHPESGASGWDAFTPPGERRHGFDFWYSYGAMDHHLTPHYWMNKTEKVETVQWSPQHETDIAMSYLRDRDKERPFCMFLSWNPPHPPYDLLPESYIREWDGRELHFRDNVPEHFRQDQAFQKAFREYYGAVEGLDGQFGRLMDFLKAEDIYDDTIIVLSADHGDCMGSHGLMGKNVWYEESIRIPLYIRGKATRAGASDVLISSQDHMPTLLAGLGVTIPDTVDGRSFWNLLEGKAVAAEPEDVFLSMIPGMPEMVKAYQEKGLNQKCFGWRGIRTRTQLFIADNGTAPGIEKRYLLYDLTTDPYQLAPRQFREKEEAIRPFLERLDNYLTKLQDPFLI